MIDLNGKRILYFAPKSFGYEHEIKKEIECRGAIVEFYDERPSNTALVKALIRIDKKRIRFYTNRYFNNIINKFPNNSFDFIFILRGEAFSPLVIKKLMNSFPKAQLILYLWDSIKNNNTLEIIPFFNKVFTFDNIDAQKYSNLTFRPLFYLPEYKKVANNNHLSTNKIVFVGTVHSDRYFFIKKIEAYLKQYNFNTDFYFFFQSKLLYYKKRLIDKSFRGLTIKDFKFIPLGKFDLLKKVSDSTVILDIQHPNQNGLTMRCIETLGAKKKLITTNKEIKNYDFFNENNIFIIERDYFSRTENVDKLYSFIKKPYQDVDPQIFNTYSIESWINEVFS